MGGLGRNAVPQNAVAGAVSHRAAAPQIVIEAALALTEGRGRDLVGEVHVAGAARLREAGEEGLWPMEFVQRQVARAARGNGDKDLRYPVRVSGAAGNIDDRKASLRREAFAQRSTLGPLEEL